MEPFAIAIIGALVFGVVTTLAVFIRQLILSRDKRLNDKAHYRALELENSTLARMRVEFDTFKRFDAHYQVLGKNRDAIEYLDNKIEEILNKKLALIHRYSAISLEASASIIDGNLSQDKKNVCDILRDEIDNELKMYDDEIAKLQKERAKRWDAHNDLQKSLIEQEANRNKELNKLYHKHTSILEKLFIRHNDGIDDIATKTIESGSKDMAFIMAPLQFLLKLFRIQFNNHDVDQEVYSRELESRKSIQQLENSIAGIDSSESIAQIGGDLNNDQAAVDLIT